MNSSWQPAVVAPVNLHENEQEIIFWSKIVGQKIRIRPVQVQLHASIMADFRQSGCDAEEHEMAEIHSEDALRLAVLAGYPELTLDEIRKVPTSPLAVVCKHFFLTD